MSGMMDSSMLAGPLSSIFPSMFQMNGHCVFLLECVNEGMSGMMDSSTLAGPLSSIFPSMFQMNGHGKGSGSGVSPPQSTDRCVYCTP
jgi:hypothetical protein